VQWHHAADSSVLVPRAANHGGMSLSRDLPRPTGASQHAMNLAVDPAGRRIRLSASVAAGGGAWSALHLAPL